MWEVTHSINQESDDILSDTSSLSSDKLSTSHTLDSATDLLDLEDQRSIDTTRHSTAPPLRYDCYQSIVMGSKRKDDDSTTLSFKSSAETVLETDALLKNSWTEYGAGGPINLSDLFPGAPNFFHSLQKSNTSAPSTLMLPSQHDSTTKYDTNTDDSTGDFNNAMGELATLMLGCSILLNNTDKSPPVDDINDMNRRTSTHSPTSNIPKSFDFCFPPEGNTGTLASAIEQTSRITTNPSPTLINFPDNQRQPSNQPNGAISTIELGGEPNQSSIYHRKILPLPKRRLKKGQIPNYESAIQQSTPATTQFTFRLPSSSTTHSTLKENEGSPKLFTTTTFRYDDIKQPTKDNEMSCDYTKKPKRDGTYPLDQGSRTITYNLTSKHNSNRSQAPMMTPNVIRPSPTTSIKSSSHSPSSVRVKSIQQRLSPEKKKKKKKGMLVTDTTKQQGKQQSNLPRRRKSTIVDPPQEVNNIDTLDIVNRVSNDWICLFCQYEIFKVGWAKQIQASRRQKRYLKLQTPSSQVSSL